jgi:hypothetical protein
MASKRIVTLPSDLIERSKCYGEQVVVGYRRGDNPNSFDVSSHGAEFNVALQSHARMAECAFCEWAGIDANLALDWSRTTDDGWDVIYTGKRVDIKGTRAHGRYLIWPLNKRHIWNNKPFDYLALVRGDDPIFEVVGWVSKRRFEANFQTAGPDHVLDAGTWHMHAKDLDEIPERTSEQRLRDGLYIASLTERHLAEWRRRKAAL